MIGSDIVWRPEDDPDIRPPLEEGEVYRPDILTVIEDAIDGLSDDLRNLSLDIHDHPELGFEEKYAHDAYTAFMASRGFVVTKHYHLSTAWAATYTYGQGGRVLGINSEMDALPGIGHACGHNLIGIGGVAIACAAKAAMEQLGIDGKIILLGTPAEESGGGKVRLLDEGAYNEMDICLMCHPAPGPQHSISLSATLAVARLEVDYTGHTAHAALSPWEGKNALDAAVLAYNNISLLRQQLKSAYRVHGIFEGKDWAPNIIPDKSKMIWYVRTQTTAEVEDTVKRVIACLEAAALASGCEVKITRGITGNEIRQNKALGDELADIVRKRYGAIDYEWGIHSASTDFVCCSFALPGLHPGFSIPTVPDGGNHTSAFAEAARTMVSHDACMVVSKALAAVGMRALTDEAFLEQVKLTFEEDKRSRGL
ncbi:hypothetical protein BJ138DRAFT_1135350 [Hygrophoropsis aurantiaca]|uniref:Uncharacterized protein n=1 Tax=Hygrophoropsis aurantiaca TaxID=72124 RepID=A0ACB8AF65_9AGAM|nr:hypothetical protein BJ138DRAFT_1135350 [Hygrophoropsis aurantiaca]